MDKSGARYFVPRASDYFDQKKAARARATSKKFRRSSNIRQIITCGPQNRLLKIISKIKTQMQITFMIEGKWCRVIHIYVLFNIMQIQMKMKIVTQKLFITRLYLSYSHSHVSITRTA